MVSVFYDLQVLAYPSFFSPAERRQRLRHLRQLKQSAQRIAAISEFSRQEGLRQGLDRQRLRTIPIQVADSQHRQPTPLNLTSGGTCFTRRIFGPTKTMSCCSPHSPWHATGAAAHLKLVCTGDGLQRRESLQQLCQGLQITERVLLLVM